MTKSSNMLVIGGGVAGISAALELADQNYKVYLVDKFPSIGGVMSQLDKTFPTLDCSICILAPKMVEVARHPNVELLTYTEVKSVEKVDEDRFKVILLKKCPYVDWSKCTGCGICMEKCPTKKIPHEFEEGLINRSAIYIPFPQAVPRKATIDAQHCLKLTKDKCGVCAKICTAEAINYDMKDEEVEIEVASIVVATGFTLLDPSKVSARYGYKRYPNVLTSLQYERILSASGPFAGEILRPSDKKHPHKIAYILCVGSRNNKDPEARPYCSRFCCLYSTKSAIITKEHAPDVEVSIFYNDLRTIGKGHEEFIVRAENEYKVRYVKGLPGAVEEDPKTNNLIIRYTDLIAGNVQKEEFDMVVLAPAAIPRPEAQKLAETLGIKLNQFGFYETPNTIDTLHSSKDGIFVVGSCQAPEDISSSVAKSFGAAALAAQRGRPMTPAEMVKKEFIEKPVKPIDPPRIGVFLCHCGINIGGVVDIPKVLEYVKTLPDVKFAMRNLYTCSEDSQVQIKQAIEEHNLNRVVIGACTPRTHEALFRETIKEVGLNPYLLDFVSLRELDSWVHMKEPEAATEKAKDLIRMGISRAALLKPQQSITGVIKQSALVIGGGIAGLIATKTILDRGFEVHLLEKGSELGGFLNQLHSINFEGLDPQKVISKYKEAILSNEKANVHLSSNLKSVQGSIGNFDIVISEPGKDVAASVGVIIVAEGAIEYRKEGLFGYGESPNIYTQLDFIKKFYSANSEMKDGDTFVFINCAGGRDPKGITYCSNTCCPENLKNALALSEKFPNSKIFILYRDMRVDPEEELIYWAARKKVRFIRYKDSPLVIPRETNILVNVKDILTHLNFRLTVDHLILATPTVSEPSNKRLSELLKVPLGPMGFFLEAHPKLRPVDFATDGIFVAGNAQGPKRINEAIAQALGAASRALRFLQTGIVESEAITAYVDESLCVGCQECERLCPYGAIKIDFLAGKGVSHVNPLLCKGCGTCSVVCPASAIVMRHFEDPMINIEVDEALALLPPTYEPRIVAFLCNWCCYAGADNAGVSRFQYPPNIRVIRVMCSGRVDPLFILHAFEKGADGVFVGGCHIGDCHYISGNEKMLRRSKDVIKMLKKIGLDTRRFKLEWVSASEGKIFQKVITQFVDELKQLGPTPLRLPDGERSPEPTPVPTEIGGDNV